MRVAKSRLTHQGQTTVPAEVRRRLGLGPGSILEWDVEDGRVVVRRAGRFSSLDIHRALFPDEPPRPRTLEATEEGVRLGVRMRRGRAIR